MDGGSDGGSEARFAAYVVPVGRPVPIGSSSQLTRRWREADSNLYGAFRVKWLFLVCCSSLFRAGKAVLRPVACNQVRGARGRGQGTETLA